MKEKILQSLVEAQSALRQLTTPHALNFIEGSALALAGSFQMGGKVLIAGNGGSLCDAAHFAEELTGVFRHKRKALPALALTEPGHLSCVANDLGFEQVFARGIEAFGKEGDVFIGLTTSGNSANMVLAFERAKELGLVTISFLGRAGGRLKGCADLELIIDGAYSDRIQEAHMSALHIIIELVEHLLFENQAVELQDMLAAVRK